MITMIRAVRELRRAGKIQRSLVTRMGIFALISLVLAGFVIYDAGAGAASWMLALPLFALGLALGYTLFSRMQRVVWDDRAGLVSATRMDGVGFLILLLYIGFEVGLRRELPALLPGVASATPLVLATIAGTLMGRFIGMMREILRAHGKAMS